MKQQFLLEDEDVASIKQGAVMVVPVAPGTRELLIGYLAARPDRAKAVPGARRSFSDADKAAILARIRGGEKPYRVAKDVDIGTSTISRWMSENGLKTKRSGKHRIFSPAFKAKVVARLKKGEKVGALAKELGIVRSVLDGWWRRAK